MATPLPSQADMLTSASNKTQLITLIRNALIEKTIKMDCLNTLIITTSDYVPDIIKNDRHEKLNELWNHFEEADCIIIHQLLYAINEGAECVNVISDDTDVFLLLVHFYHKENIEAEVFVQATSGERTTINIKETVRLHESIVPYLLAAHALSGCDSVSSFYNIGKKTILNNVKKIPLEHLGEIDADKDEMLTEAKTFIVACYGVQYKEKFSVVRYQCWKIKTMKGNLNSRFKLNNFPPTNDVIELHILRAHFQTMLWKHSNFHQPPEWDPLEYVWIEIRKADI